MQFRNLIFAVVFSAALWASPTGSIMGTVKDASGAVMPGVRITVTNIATNARLTATSDANGAYQFPQLPPANYRLAAEAQGFKKAYIASVVVEVDQVTHADLTLEVAASPKPWRFRRWPLCSNLTKALSATWSNRASFRTCL